MASSATTWVKFATGAILSITVSWLVTACDATPTEKNVSVAQEADQQSPPHETKSKEQPPNIIYILADDLGYGDLGVYGQTKIQTPNLDRMAANGVLFTQHNSGSTVCAPSRSALMTGQHPGLITGISSSDAELPLQPLG